MDDIVDQIISCCNTNGDVAELLLALAHRLDGCSDDGRDCG